MSYRTIDGIPIWGQADENTINQARNCKKFFDEVFLMGDNHLGYSIPIGGVVVSRDYISPSAVGMDIGCGNKAIELDVSLNDIKPISQLMNDIWKILSFGIGLNNKETTDHPIFYEDTWNLEPLCDLQDLARNQLGTIGSGNHFVDIFADENSKIWVGVHFGSRGLGYKIASYFLKKNGAKDGMNVDPLLLHIDTQEAQDYLVCMKLAGRYAYAGRDWVCEKIRSIIGANIVSEVHNHHNFAWEEKDTEGNPVWVMRKGSTPSYPGQKCFVGGSMGDNSVILEGIDTEESRINYHSSMHGAGRSMSRNEARGRVDHKSGIHKTEGKVSKEMMNEWLNNRGIILRGADTDESPQAYKRLDSVLEAHSNCIKIIHTLRPLGVAMAGPDTLDPYKD